jgi:hypothetical protein
VGIGTINPQAKVDIDGGDIIVQGAGSFDAVGEQATVWLGDFSHYIKAQYGYGLELGTWPVGDVRGWPGMIAYSPNGHRREFQFYDDKMTIAVSPSSAPSSPDNGIQILENGRVIIRTLEIIGGSEFLKKTLMINELQSNFVDH